MNFYKKHSFLHYFAHTALAVLFLSFLILSENILPKNTLYGSNITFGEQTIETKGTAYKQLNFEKKRVYQVENFFEGEAFETQENSAVDLSFSDFTVLRSDENTKFSIQKSNTPEISLSEGSIWISTKEYVVTHLPQAQVETLAGSSIVTKNKKGRVTVVAWDKPSRITFFDAKGEILWKFLLPSHYQVSFSPDEYFSKKEFSHFRFSKLKKEFSIRMAKENNFIQRNQDLDISWKESVIRKIKQRKSPFFNESLSASLFSFSTKRENAETQTDQRSTIMNIWESIDRQQFSVLDQKIKDFSPLRKKNFYKYAGFFPKNKRSYKVFIKSFPEKSGKIWPELWTLESMMANDMNTGEQDKSRKKILEEIKKSKYDTEEIQFFANSLFQNYSQNISYPTIDFFYDINEVLITEEVSPQRVMTRKLEIIQDVFSFSKTLIQQKEYLLARKLLDKVETYIDEDTSPLLANQKEKILKQKNYIRGKVEYAEILGDGNRERLDSYISIKETIKDYGRDNSFHSAPKDKAIQSVKQLLKKENISVEDIQASKENSEFFHLIHAQNKDGLKFSGNFDLKTKKFSGILFRDKNDTEIFLADGYIFSLREIAQIKKKSIEEIIIAQNTQKEEFSEDNTKKIPSEISDLVHTIAQEQFIKNDLMVTTYNIDIVSINTAEINEAVPHYETRQRIKQEEEIRSRLGQGKNPYAIHSKTKILPEEYTISFHFNIETQKAFNIVAQSFGESFALEGEKTISEMITELDKKARKIREQNETKEEVLIHLKTIGVHAEISDMTWKNASRVGIKNMEERTTKVVFNGEYNPIAQRFEKITFLNIAPSPVSLPKSISLSDLEKDFSKQQENLQKKVKEFGE